MEAPEKPPHRKKNSLKQMRDAPFSAISLQRVMRESMQNSPSDPGINPAPESGRQSTSKLYRSPRKSADYGSFADAPSASAL